MSDNEKQFQMSILPAVKMLVPKYIATKTSCTANMASGWFRTSLVLMLLNHPWARPAALISFIIALVISCVAGWFSYVEDQENKMLRESRK